jgi:hypothetical protein
MGELPNRLRGGATELERITASQMGSNQRIVTIVDHALAARRLALAEDEPFLVMLLDMLLLETGKLLAAQCLEQEMVPEREGARE